MFVSSKRDQADGEMTNIPATTNTWSTVAHLYRNVGGQSLEVARAITTNLPVQWMAALDGKRDGDVVVLRGVDGFRERFLLKAFGEEMFFATEQVAASCGEWPTDWAGCEIRQPKTVAKRKAR
jgi:hypothetical protein